MKRFISVMLILAFVLSMAALTACGEKEVKEEEENKRVPDGEVFELKDQFDKYSFTLQAYTDSSLTYKMEPYSDRQALVVTSKKGEFTVYVYINNGYRNNYNYKHDGGEDDGGKDIQIGDLKGYTYPATVLNAAFIDTEAKVEDDADLISLVVEQLDPFKHDINEVIDDSELVELLETIKLVKSPLDSTEATEK